MPAGVTLTINTTQMQAALEQYLQQSRHSTAFVINRKLFFIAKRAYDLTPIAKRERIQETFSVTQTERTVKRGRFAGKIRRVTNYSGLNKSAFAIMNWKRRKKGLPALRGAEALKAAKGMVASRLRAIGSLKSGWVGAILRLRRIVADAFVPAFKNKLQNPGAATPARKGPNPTAEIAYRLAIKKKSGEKIDPRVIAALQQAFNDEAADTLRHLAERLQQDANKVNAK
jgi:hypothetical protein